MAHFSSIIHLLNQNNITAIVLGVEIISSFSVVFFHRKHLRTYKEKKKYKHKCLCYSNMDIWRKKKSNHLKRPLSNISGDTFNFN